MKGTRFAAALAAVVAIGMLPDVAFAAPTAPTAACPDEAPLRQAADHWISGHAKPADSTWFNSLFIKGDLELFRLTGDAKYLKFGTDWGAKNNWKLPTNAPNYDGPEASQEYLDLYELDPAHPAKYIADAQAYVKKQTTRVQGGKVSDMDYVDAVRLGGLSAFARMPGHTQANLDAMAKMFSYTESHIYDKKASLWWRDKRWAGDTQHWSRGNGWIVIALTDTVAALPADDPYRVHYVSLLRDMSAKLKATQQAGGYWTADVDHPAAYPAPESSGTSFFTYGLAKGIQLGYLDSATYLPVVQKAWGWLRGTALRSNGVVGYVQGPSSHPSQYQPISPTATSNYGVGAFLMAGVAAAKFTPGC
ncbi:Rhamnogalacturonyl hydrolase YesR [Amycolatopsis xylanica]|uniref:Rhamnogalacturonyl hydrolase YesR n=1 Tax=Amycolatopsis xylanica TaxID=589385 RepID=A0A1H2T3I0_9PSEU|nr:glycoside hydrolase family 88 protein [Amycolatopsis xylanica]SDW37814.1 Rhamnogalacturonyl hydrolase YesR [Amycolatopsis xylanica]